MIKNFVISMTSAQNRREHIRNEFGKHNIPFEFFDAVTPGDSLDNAMALLVPNLAPKKDLSGGEKGCFMSHVCLWHKCVEENLPYIAIYEDDVLLGKDAATFLADDTWLKNLFPMNHEFFIVRPETTLMKVGEKSFKDVYTPLLDTHYKLNRLTSLHYGAGCYIISHATAKFLLNIVKNTSTLNLKPLDHILFRQYLQTKEAPAYQLNPAVVIQEIVLLGKDSSLNSDIEADREIIRHTQKTPLSIPKKLIREMKKIPNALRKTFCYKTVPFK